MRAAIFLGVVATLSVPLAVGAASASEGSVPAEVSAWASDPAGLVASLDDLVGVGGDGKGIDFGEDATTVGQLNRVFTFTSDFLAGVATETPVERQNEWTAPISVSEKLIGLATIWIDPDTIQPDLADFVQGASLPESFVDVAADSYLVHDVDRGAWFTLTGDSLTVLVPGSSGVSATTPLTVYQGLISTRAAAVPTPAPTVNSGIVTSIIIIGVAIVGVVGIMIAAQLRANRRPASNPVDVAAPTTTQPEAIAAAAAPAEVTAPVVAATPKKTPAKPAATKPAAAKPTAAKPAAATPATPKKPTATKPAAAKAPATKPAAVKPATAKPSTPKPGTAAKPATAKPATAKPATAKPPRAKPTPAKPATAKPPSAKPATVRTTATAPAAASTRAPAKPRTPKPKPDAPTA